MAIQLSDRGQQRALQFGSNIPSKEKFYDENLNPDGPISLATAENQLLSNELLKFINERFEISLPHLRYRSAIARGFTRSTFDVMPNFLNKTLRPKQPITVDQVAIGPGIGAILAHLLWHLCGPGDGVLLTAPFYSDYVRDIIYPAQAVPVIIPIPVEVDPLMPEVIPYIRRAIEEARSKDQVISAIMLNNPHNPLAGAYPVETIIEYAKVAEEYNIHLVADEVFANEIFPSKYNPDPTPFTSILSLDTSSFCNPSRIHVLAGPSKDFGASGIKIGGLVSQHHKVLIDTINVSLNATPISSTADAVFTAILDDEVFYDWFLDENRKRLTRAFELVASWCEFHGFPFVKAQAGVFMMIDFASLINKCGDSDTSISDKGQIAVGKMQAAGVLLQPPSVYQDPSMTRMRVVFTLPESIMKLALRRIETAFSLPHMN